MDTEAFVAWALSPQRDLEDRYTLELLAEQGVSWWNSKRKIYHHRTLDESVARSRERELNPAYRPKFDEEGLRKTAESLAELTSWTSLGPRHVSSVRPLVFFPTLTSVHISPADLNDYEPLTQLPKLESLKLNSYRPRQLHTQDDFTPLARCRQLRELELTFTILWPNLEGLDTLPLLEKLTLTGNLLALPRGIAFSRVRQAKLHGQPLPARSVADFPRLPLCELLELGGVERLDGIEHFPRLRNLELKGHFRSFAPLVALEHLTWLNVLPHQFGDIDLTTRDVSPLARLPRLKCFMIGPRYDCWQDLPRDYAPLAEAPELRQLVVRHCPPVQMEVAALNASLAGWEDEVLLPLPEREAALAQASLRVIVARHPTEPSGGPAVEDPAALPDKWIIQSAAGWFARHLASSIAERSGHPEWGIVESEAYAHYRLRVEIHSFAALEEFPVILATVQSCLAAARDRWVAGLQISLRVPKRELTPAEKALEAELSERQEKWEYEQQMHDRARYLENLHQVELKRQQGLEITPEDFSPAPYGRDYPQREDLAREKGLTSEEDDTVDDDDGDGGTALDQTKDEEDFPLDDDEHPLASKYYLFGTVDAREAWFHPRQRDLVVYLLKREPDVYVPLPEKSEDE